MRLYKNQFRNFPLMKKALKTSRKHPTSHLTYLISLSNNIISRIRFPFDCNSNYAPIKHLQSKGQTATSSHQCRNLRSLWWIECWPVIFDSSTQWPRFCGWPRVICKVHRFRIPTPTTWIFIAQIDGGCWLNPTSMHSEADASK